VTALYARKQALGVSDRVLDAISGLCHGHTSKLIGPGRERGLSQISLDALLGALACKLVIVEDEVQASIMKSRWESRNSQQLRMPARIGKALLARTRGPILRELAQRAGRARWRNVDPAVRRRLMTELIRRRWNSTNSLVSSPEPQQETAGAP
jgi:hypothetical protein